MGTRRRFIARIFASVPLFTVAGFTLPSFKKWYFGNHEIRFADLLIGAPRDWADGIGLAGSTLSSAPVPAAVEAFLIEDLRKHISHLSGKVVELGVHPRCTPELQNRFGLDRYMGVDIVSAVDLAGVIQRDVRQLEDLAREKAVFVWNDIGTWKDSPRSRKAALEWTQRNLQPGGIYIDGNAHSIPVDIDYSQFELLCKGQGFTIFKKII